MKIAFCISGEVRLGFDRAFKSFQKNVKQILPNFDIFISTWENELSKDFIDLMKPKKFNVEIFCPNKLLHYNEYVNLYPDIVFKNTIPMLYKRMDMLNLIDDSYDIVISTRPDLWYATPIDLYQIINNIYNQNIVAVHLDQNGNHFDGFAIGSFNTIKKYSELYLSFFDQVKKYNCPIIHQIQKNFLFENAIQTIHPNGMIGIIRKDIDKSVLLHFNRTHPVLREIGMTNLDNLVFKYEI